MGFSVPRESDAGGRWEAVFREKNQSSVWIKEMRSLLLVTFVISPPKPAPSLRRKAHTCD